MSTRAERRIAKLWSRYRRQPAERLRNALLEHYLPLVEASAKRLRMRLPACVEVDDLVGYGVFGLLEAIESYDVHRNISFPTFSTRRIRGAMLDELRTLDWLPRHVRLAARKTSDAETYFRVTAGRAPSEEELTGELGLTPAGYRELDRHVRASDHRPLQRALFAGSDNAPMLPADVRTEDPAKLAQRRLLKELLLTGLTREERLIITLYYYEELTMAEIGDALGISESRVSQLRKAIVLRLRSRLKLVGGNVEVAA